jgi:hypothetical protein
MTQYRDKTSLPLIKIWREQTQKTKVKKKNTVSTNKKIKITWGKNNKILTTGKHIFSSSKWLPISQAEIQNGLERHLK